ncbi:putative molybdenum carrier protein [Novipirellula artificiosorum]|uniref:Putative molybdenum carrier n=1 Tax=Novipirellula artificiosorum TaxID=2528016 RepID=A0A5C6DSP1_9BACT|nr:putative molybdenum carrier protein [Novipirellula artificiosorum]TWU39662.1 putative molybdenum carrier [Novipirellula artificiosorum]
MRRNAKSPAAPFVPNKIVSGGQTGVDRAGLECAIALGIEHGGWCPAARLSEDGSIPSRYMLTETDSRDYPARTELNVVDSDATLILYERKLTGGTLLTYRICRRLSKDFLLARLDRDDVDLARQWIDSLRPETLNVAGPRESTSPGIERRSMMFLMQVFANR